MSDGHYCSIHGVPFFKKGSMKGYAHPIEGTDPVEWCNEPKEEELKADKPAFRENSTNSSIESQVAVKAVVELWLADKATEQMKQAASNWIMSKLGNWSSVGPAPEEEPIATQARLNKIYTVSKEKGYDSSLATAIMLRLYNTAHSKQLTKTQASDFIEKLSTGYGLDDKPIGEINPESIPF